jgi:DNA-directed RNA polymerase subunit RPC12/RpoP
MNPHWTQIIFQTTKKASRKCAHCGKIGVYAQKKKGQFYTCKKCGHRFMEREG